ncbi:hypothetical protein Salat_2713800 [Sesamum alatum]|uniref:Uncharacterized protein n=1 Tax=Sesamum alatum TaxID=300844 RepID=A0AAE1XQ94_9LAMI|nr:hypothetical protein Salat_2713800 [Sesamum alatum]
MGPEVEVGEKSKAKMESSPYKSNGMFAIELEEELMKYTNNYEENKGDANLVGQIAEVHRDTDVEVNITECTKSGGVDLVEAECLDTTESSSSFDDCDYGVENVNTLADSEALSDFHGDAASALDFDGFSEMFRMRKKKPTTHWRSFIHPLMWRCKWVELQIKKFEAQAREYDRKLDEYSQRKQTQLEIHPLEGLGVKSFPLGQSDATTEVLRRKKRRRAEATEDVAAYMSHHNLFSYYEDRKHFTEGASMDNELKNPAKRTQKVNTDDECLADDEMLRVETGSGDKSLEHIFQKIEFLQSRVGKLKSRVDKVISAKAEMFPSTENLSLPVSDDALIESPLNTATPPNDEDRMPVGNYIAAQLISEFNMSDLLVPESILTDQGEVFTDANGSINHISFADACGNGDDELLIDNWRVNEEMNSFEEVMIQSTQRPLVLKDASGSTSPPVPAEADLPMDDEPPPRTRSISKLIAPTSKTKRGRQKSVGR